MTASAAGSARVAPRSAVAGIALAVVAATVASGIVNFLLSLAAQALGADVSTVMGLQPQTFLLFTLIGTLVGAIGWQVIRRVTATPSRVLRVLVPVVVVLSLIPDAWVAVSFSAVGGIALGLMHLVVAAAAVPAYRRFLPLAR
ncbi:DUF6069 family protein [Pseudonocardia phyllosphaerae]|uniref:DUF6069 family protein n=1 Tax=Pseudonocardia phyllosphaerae TaxID=3390502 RepID=UPI00397D27A2